MPLFSIVTPCFNSSKTLYETYQSLIQQSCNDFEWILIDDASIDDGATLDLINKIKKDAPFPVKVCLLKNNYFGSRSVFMGCSVASGKYVAVLDHDDQLTNNALYTVKKYITEYLNNDVIAGVCGRCVNKTGAMIGRMFDSDCFIANEGDVRFNQGITSELFQFTRIEIIKPFFEKMKTGYTNGYVWAKVSEKYSYVFVNDIFRVYDVDLPTSYTNTKGMSVRYPVEKAEALRSTIIVYRRFLKNNILYSSKIIGSYLRHTINGKLSFFSAINGFDSLLKIWCFLMYPIALLKALRLYK